MKQVCPKIDNVKIVSSYIEIERDIKKNNKVSVEFRAKVGTPKETTDKSLLINLILNVSSTETEDIKIKLEADYFVSYEEEPEDFDEMMKLECLPILQKSLSDKLDNILVEFGYGKLHIGED